MNLVLIIILLLTLTACAPSGRYSMKNDKAPLRKPTTIEMQNAIPKVEPIYPWSLKSYVVFGKRYHPLKTAEGYTANGIASWYGRKFHGHTTANGETYDMFAMTAAHKTLPIPSYVRVTNTANNKTIVVRVNDRGPFHHNRVIDLSYAAAYAIDMLNQGTAQVKLETIIPTSAETNTEAPKVPLKMPEPCEEAQVSQAKATADTQAHATSTAPEQVKAPTATTDAKTELPVLQTQMGTVKKPINSNDKKKSTSPELIKGLFVQVVASTDGDKINTLGQKLSTQFNQDYRVIENQSLYILRLGPLQSEPQAEALAQALKNNGFGGAYKLYSQSSLPHN